MSIYTDAERDMLSRFLEQNCTLFSAPENVLLTAEALRNGADGNMAYRPLLDMIYHARTAGEEQPIDTCPSMICVLLYNEYYSHGCWRIGYRDARGSWKSVNSDGREGYLAFSPTAWKPLPRDARIGEQ